MADLMSQRRGQLRFRIGGTDQSGLDVNTSAGERDGVGIVALNDLDGERELRNPSAARGSGPGD